MDYICVLTARSPRDAIMTKTLYRATNGAIGKTGYDNGYLFDVQKIAIDSLGGLAEVIAELVNRADCFIIRALPTGAHHNVPRRLQTNGGVFTADPDGHHWFMLDFDEVALPIFLEPDDDPELLLQYLVRLLPKAFHDVSFIWQWSCGHGIDQRSLRAHLWFWSRDKHTDYQFENWAKTLNGGAGWKIIDHVVFRTVQPNYICAPIIANDVIDPVNGERQGVFIGSADEVVIDIPTRSWEQHVRDLERLEYEELVEYGLRPPYASLDRTPSNDTYLDYLLRIGDNLDGFYDPMTKAIWHFARTNPPAMDEAFKVALRQVVRGAVCTKQRDLEQYLSDYRLDASLRGAREKQQHFQAKPQGKLAEIKAVLRRDSFTRKVI